jgi:valyl-tRNA synthetase
MTRELAPRYDPQSVEERIYRSWEEAGYFRPEACRGERTFTIVIPPPNVTGVLHMGHALNNTLQDVAIRFHRMRGERALWLPGTDHAGIATQNVVERELKKKGLRRQDLGREKFVEEVWRWKDTYEKRILGQLKRLGASCDWSRTRFTMDEGLSRAVRVAFVKLFERGLMYRGKYVVNGCPRCATALSDEEAEKKETKGHLWRIRYPVKGDASRSVTVATTRPETMLGDVAVAVHPADDRYRALVGKTLVLPLARREIPVVADEAVDRAFGTGAVKVTPAHDFADFEIARRHGLPMPIAMNPDATMSDFVPERFRGLDRYEARKRVVEELEREGFLEGTDEHVAAIGFCYRCGTAVEPTLSDQWFVRMKPLAEKVLAAQRAGRLRFHPPRWERIFVDWLENVRDWCVSRQLWWGHRVPVYWCGGEGCGEYVAAVEAPATPCSKCGAKAWRPDEDVLDTWCSSWLWPFSTLGWPDETEDLATYYPTNLLSTDRNILYFWVARMVMAGLEFLGEVPFRDVNIHGTVLDARGRRMSKSAGNGIDPLDMIAQYGADAVRFSLVVLSREGQDLRLSVDRFRRGQFFCNKVWNAARFVRMNLDRPPAPLHGKPVRLEDRWIRSRLAATVRAVTEALEDVRFHDAAEAIYAFTWNELCDWTIELAKRRLAAGGEDGDVARRVLLGVLDATLRLLHPYAPHLTEEIWGSLREGGLVDGAPALIVAPWPEMDADAIDPEAESAMSLLQGIVRAVRSLRHIHGIGERESLEAVLSVPDPQERAILEREGEIVRALAAVSRMEVRERADRPPRSGVAVVGTAEVFVLLPGNLDVAKQRAALEKKIARVEEGLRAADARLSNEGFLRGADPDVVEAERARREELRVERDALRRNLEGLS